MKRALGVVWVWALLWNGYATWMWASGFARVGFRGLSTFTTTCSFWARLSASSHCCGHLSGGANSRGEVTPT